jgi:hypothetical protein
MSGDLQMKTYQVVLTNCDILQVKAMYAERNGPYLCFYDKENIDSGDVKVLAEFREWAGWNELEEDKTPMVCDQ